MKEIPQNPNDYKYIPELNEYLPRVTTILKIVSKGDAFNNWLKKQGDKADNLLSTAGDIGTGIHNLLETIGKGEPINPEKITPQEKKWVEEFEEWKETNVEKFLETEKTVWTNEYVGTLDSLVLMRDKRIALLDFKTSRYIYDTAHAQVSSYVNAHKEMYTVKIDTAFILRFDKNGRKMEVKEVTDLDYQFENFTHALRLWYWKREMYRRAKE